MKFPKLKVSKTKTERLEFGGGVRLDGKAEENQLSSMSNLQINEGELSLRPSLEFCAERIYWGDYDYFTVDGRTFGISADGDINLACFNNSGVLKNIVNIHANATDAVALIDRDRAVIYYMGKNGPLVTKITKMDSDNIEIDGNLSIEDEAYIPTVSVGGTGYYYENEEEIKPYAYNGKRYEDKNLIANKYVVTQTTNFGKNVYVLPYPIGCNAELKAEYTDDVNMRYEYGMRTSEEGLFGYTEPDDTIDMVLRSFGDDRRTLVFMNWGENSFSKAYTPYGNYACNRFIITIKEGKGDDAICSCNRSAIFRAKDGETTWIVYGSKKSPSTLLLTGNSDIFYFPESGRVEVGADNDAVSAVVQVGDRVAVLKQGSLWLGEIETGKKYTQNELDSGETKGDVGATVSFTSKKIADIGCDCPETAISCNGRLVWLNSDGVVRMMSAVINPSEDDVCELSYSVEPIIKGHSVEELKGAYAAFCDGKYYLLIGNDLLVLDCMSNAMENYSSYSDDLTAQKKLCWMSWNVANEGVRWMALRGDKKLYLYGHKGDESIVTCSLTGSSGNDKTGKKTQSPIEWSAKTGTVSLGSGDDTALSARLTAMVTAENEVTASILNENGRGGSAKIKPSEASEKLTVINGERGNAFSAEFSGKGRVKIDNVTLSCRKK